MDSQNDTPRAMNTPRQHPRDAFERAFGVFAKKSKPLPGGGLPTGKTTQQSGYQQAPVGPGPPTNLPTPGGESSNSGNPSSSSSRPHTSGSSRRPKSSGSYMSNSKNKPSPSFGLNPPNLPPFGAKTPGGGSSASGSPGISGNMPQPGPN